MTSLKTNPTGQQNTGAAKGFSPQVNCGGYQNSG